MKVTISKSKAEKNKLKMYIAIALSAFVIAVGISVFLFFKLNNLNNNPQLLAEKETQSILNKVGKILILPKDETPMIATVTDLSKLKGQSFFANAKVGDKVLIYNKYEKAILYNPATNKIIEVAPINGTGATSSTTFK